MLEKCDEVLTTRAVFGLEPVPHGALICPGETRDMFHGSRRIAIVGT